MLQPWSWALRRSHIYPSTNNQPTTIGSVGLVLDLFCGQDDPSRCELPARTTTTGQPQQLASAFCSRPCQRLCGPCCCTSCSTELMFKLTVRTGLTVPEATDIRRCRERCMILACRDASPVPALEFRKQRWQ